MDRIDVHIEVPAVPYKHLGSTASSEPSVPIRTRVTRARDVQTERLAGTSIFCNAQMSNRHLKMHCKVDDVSHSLLESAIDTLGLSARAFSRILKIARTIADLENLEHISSDHIAEAIQYRSLDRGRKKGV